MMVILTGCSTGSSYQDICAKLMEQRARQVINNHPAASISLTDQMLIKCGCLPVHDDTMGPWIRRTRAYIDSLQIVRAKN